MALSVNTTNLCFDMRRERFWEACSGADENGCPTERVATVSCGVHRYLVVLPTLAMQSFGSSLSLAATSRLPGGAPRGCLGGAPLRQLLRLARLPLLSLTLEVCDGKHSWRWTSAVLDFCSPHKCQAQLASGKNSWHWTSAVLGFCSPHVCGHSF